MGQRQLLVDPVVLVDLLKGPGETVRNFTVQYALPPDAEFVESFPVPGRQLVLLTLESESWNGDVGIWLEPPIVYIHFGRRRKRRTPHGSVS